MHVALTHAAAGAQDIIAQKLLPAFCETLLGSSSGKAGRIRLIADKGMDRQLAQCQRVMRLRLGATRYFVNHIRAYIHIYTYLFIYEIYIYIYIVIFVFIFLFIDYIYVYIYVFFFNFIFLFRLPRVITNKAFREAGFAWVLFIGLSRY